jgi:hypothetical protein
MKRRDFFKVGAGATALGLSPLTPVPAAVSVSAAAAVLAGYTTAEQRQRLLNIGRCQQAIRACMRKHLIGDYLPGQCCYNLGEYPARKIWNPDDWDERELDALHAQGIRLIQVHEEWNDSQRLFGGHKLTAANPAGMRRFVDMVHRRGMKLIVYVSSGYFDRKDPDFRPEWATAKPFDLREIYFQYVHCSPASPGWRAYFLPRLVRILDEFGVDGIYNDLGYRQPGNPASQRCDDQVLAFDETPEHDGALGDLLGMIYDEVHRRGGIVKIHRGGANAPLTDVKVYDYLWVGEGGKDSDKLRQATRNHSPYVVPCLDMSRAKIDREEDLYLQSLPYLQFPLLLAGRPFTGERGSVPGIVYPPAEKCFWTRHMRAIGTQREEHPQGPFSYGWWDSVPGRPEARPTHARWLKRYQSLVEPGTWVWLEIADSDWFTGPLPAGVVASAFANRGLHLVLANYAHEPVEVQTRGAWRSDLAPTAAAEHGWPLPARSLTILHAAPIG